jgi:hypothetical protein
LDGFYLVASIGATIELSLRRTLVLQQFYSSIVAVACPDRSEEFCLLFSKIKREPY